MDTSKEYVLMCSKARLDLNKLRGFEKIDDVYIKNGKAFMPYRGYEAKTPQTIPDGVVWLPRQDQLQEMVEKEDIAELLYNFVIFTGSPSCDHRVLKEEYNNFSMEQLWLAFVMKEKFNKHWNGEDWNKIN